MTTKTEITRQIEELLGSEGTPELAAELLPHLEQAGVIIFDASRGYQTTDRFDAEFGVALARLIEEVR